MSEEKIPLKVDDIVKNFTEKNKKDTEVYLNALSKLQAEYSNMEDMASPERLEQIKREMGSYLSSLSTSYSKIKCYKSNHEYLEEERKQIKSDAVRLIVDRDNLSVAAAEKIVYSEQYYKERVELLQRLKRFFWNVELKYQRYSETLRDIYQSISQLSAERRMTQ